MPAILVSIAALFKRYREEKSRWLGSPFGALDGVGVATMCLPGAGFRLLRFEGLQDVFQMPDGAVGKYKKGNESGTRFA